jgi:hypothetical protein
MAESAPTIEAVDYFAAAANFHVQESSTEELKEFEATIGATGNYACSQEYDEGDGYMSRYRYCNGTPDIDTDLGTLLTTFGQVADSKAVTGLRVEFRAGVSAEVTIEGHQHDSNPHTSLANADCSGIIPASSGVGVPALIAVAAGTCSPVRATLEIDAGHRDHPGADGTHFHGQNVGPVRVAITVEYEGQPTSMTAGNWLNIKIAKSNPNDETPTATVTAEQYVDFT